MSSQLDGHLQLPSSYNFNKETTLKYKASTIDPTNFHAWLKNDMYASSYAKHHSPVQLISLRIQLSPKLDTSLDTLDLFLRIERRASMLRHTPIKQRKYLVILSSMPIEVA